MSVKATASPPPGQIEAGVGRIKEVHKFPAETPAPGPLQIGGQPGAVRAVVAHEDVHPVGQVDDLGHIPAGGVQSVQEGRADMVEQHAVRPFPQRREPAEKEVPVDGVLPDVLRLELDHPVDLVGLVGAHVVEHGQKAKVL